MAGLEACRSLLADTGGASGAAIKDRLHSILTGDFGLRRDLEVRGQGVKAIPVAALAPIAFERVPCCLDGFHGHVARVKDDRCRAGVDQMQGCPFV